VRGILGLFNRLAALVFAPCALSGMQMSAADTPALIFGFEMVF